MQRKGLRAMEEDGSEMESRDLRKGKEFREWDTLVSMVLMVSGRGVGDGI